MRILFTLIGNSRRNNYLDGKSIRFEKVGASGTDTSTILVGEYLAKNGFEVVIATEDLEKQIKENIPKCEKKEIFRTVNNVTYTDLSLTGIENREFDFLVNSLWFEDYESLNVRIKKGVIYWCHMQWIYGQNNLIEYCNKNNLTAGIINISEWEKLCNYPVIETIKGEVKKFKQILIPNPILLDIIPLVEKENIKRKKNKFIFHASWSRGGDVALKYLKKSNLKDWELHAFDYLITVHDHNDQNFFNYQSVDKLTLYKHLKESEYFLYPLSTPYGDVHKDTFSCVVAEALALGCIPVTYTLGAIEEYFGEYIIPIKFPDNIDMNLVKSTPLFKDENNLFKNNDKILNILRSLQQYPTKDGEKYIKNNFNLEKIGVEWKNFLNQL